MPSEVIGVEQTGGMVKSESKNAIYLDERFALYCLCFNIVLII